MEDGRREQPVGTPGEDAFDEVVEVPHAPEAITGSRTASATALVRPSS
jgi:hypothetical protein